MAKLIIHHGTEKPLVAVGVHQVALLDFAFKYPTWHYHATDRNTQRAIDGLLARGSIQKNGHGQFKVNL